MILRNLRHNVEDLSQLQVEPSDLQRAIGDVF